MRITNGMIINNTLNGLSKNMNAINKTYAQMTTGKKIQTVSDDPIIAGRALKLKTSVLENSQYTSNAKEATSFMEITEGALDNIHKILQTIRTKCVEAATGTLENSDKEVINEEIQQLWKQLQEEANTTYQGRYVFSGYKTGTPLMENGKVNETINTEGQSIEYEIGTSSTISVNTTGMDEIFKKMTALFEEIDSQFKADETTGEAVEEGEAETDSTSASLSTFFDNKLKEIDDILAEVSKKTSDLGARMSRVEYVESRLTEQKTTLTNLLSETEDIDIEEVYVTFNTQYATYQSALQATAKVITNTLADYL